MSDTKSSARALRGKMRPIAALIAAVALACGLPGASGAKAGNDDVARAVLGVAAVAIVGAAIADALSGDHRHGRQVVRPGRGHAHAAPIVRRAPVIVHRAPVRVVGRGHDGWRNDGRRDGWRADSRGRQHGWDDRRGDRRADRRDGAHGAQNVWRGDARHDAGGRDGRRGDVRGDRLASGGSPRFVEGRAAAVQRETERRRRHMAPGFQR